MTADTENSAVTRSSGFKPGVSGNAKGRPRRGNSFAELVRGHKLTEKRAVVETAFREAIAGDVTWAMWLAKVSGDLNADPNRPGLMRELVVREYAGWPEHVE